MHEPRFHEQTTTDIQIFAAKSIFRESRTPFLENSRKSDALPQIRTMFFRIFAILFAAYNLVWKNSSLPKHSVKFSVQQHFSLNIFGVV